MALSSPESPVPPRRVVINRTENPSEEREELNKMAHGVVAESRRFVLLVVDLLHGHSIIFILCPPPPLPPPANLNR